MQLRLFKVKFWKKPIKYFCIFILSGLLFGVFLLFLNFFQIDSLELVGSNKQIQGISSLYGKNIIFLSSSETVNDLLNQNPQLQQIKVQKILPNKLRIEFTLEKSWTYLKGDIGFFELSDQAKIIAKKKKTDEKLPIINYYQKLGYAVFNTGDTIEYQDVKIALHFLKITFDLGMQVDTIDINGNNMIAFGIDQKRVLFSVEKDVGKQKYELETIIKRFKIEGKQYKTLDLRFEKPVVKF